MSDMRKYLSNRLLENREKVLERVQKSISEDNIALAFGAGVSIPAKLPTWAGLISQLLGYAVQRDLLTSSWWTDDQRESMLKTAELLIHGNLKLLSDVNPLESAEYVVQYFDEGIFDSSVTDEVREHAIISMFKKIVDSSLTPDQILKQTIDENSSSPLKKVREMLDVGMPLTEAIAGLHQDIAHLNSLFAASYLMARETNGIRRAITYNYDPLIQEQLLALYGLQPDTVITHPGRWNEQKLSNEREVFHVHGFIPGTRHSATGFNNVYPINSGRIILSEDSYYVLEREEAYNWSSSIQSYFLNRYHCLFVGFSAEDFNFRRILRQIGQERETGRVHYLLLSVNKLAKATEKAVNESRKSGYDISDEDITLLLEQLLSCREKYWKRFGIYPIFADRDEIPDILCKL